MHQNPQAEEHFSSSDTLRDIVIGMADGLTVPFALAAGLTGAVDSNKTIIVAGFAEIAAGAIAMGLGGYLAARNDAEHYESERRREELEVIERKDDEVLEVLDVLGGYGLTPEHCHPSIKACEGNHKAGGGRVMGAGTRMPFQSGAGSVRWASESWSGTSRGSGVRGCAV